MLLIIYAISFFKKYEIISAYTWRNSLSITNINRNFNKIVCEAK